MATRCAKRPTASDALALLQHARRSPLDVAFIDIGLPGGMDGYELARRIRSHPAGAMCGWWRSPATVSPKTASNHSQAGFARHLVKPVDPEALQRELSAPRPEIWGHSSFVVTNGDRARDVGNASARFNRSRSEHREAAQPKALCKPVLP